MYAAAGSSWNKELSGWLPPAADRRFAALDAMRGIAAISIMFFHYFMDTPNRLFSNAYYAVDLFFVLSGFVLTHSYSPKIGQTVDFLRYMSFRLIRLYPLYLVGMLLGLVMLPLYINASLTQSFDFKDYALAATLGAFFLPYPNAGMVPLTASGSMPGALFPLDIPAWSLFFELLASVFLYVVIKSNLRVIYIVLLSFVPLIAAILHHKTLNLGWGVSSVSGGLARTAFMFSLGILLFKMFNTVGGWRRTRDPTVFLVITAACLATPGLDFLGIHVSSYFICVALLLNLFCCAFIMDWGSEYRPAICNWLGRISYGVYAIHLPLYLTAVLLLRRTSWAAWIDGAPVSFGCVMGIIVLASAYLATAFLDEPLRQKLKARLR